LLELEAVSASKRILIADDNRDAADSLALLLDFLGYDTRVAYDGQQATEVAKEFDPSLVILDINMPVMDGYSAAKVLRHERGERVILVALTAVTSREAQQRALEAGFDVHLAKPLGGSELEALLRRVLH
jgi:DNA-binding response OmpR family regulator